MAQAASTQERNVVPRPVVGYQAVKMVQILKELGAEPLIEGEGANLFRSDEPLECVSAVSFDTIGKHKPKGRIEAGCFDVQVSYSFGGKLFFIALRMRKPVVAVAAGKPSSRN